MSTKKCYLICPFGDENSGDRQNYDELFKSLQEWGKDNGCEFGSSNKDLSGKLITESMIDDIYSADIVIADLSNSNPNVCYELALRHSIGKPVIHISSSTKETPFDLANFQILPKPSTLSPESIEGIIGNAIRKIKEDSCLRYPAYSNNPFVKTNGVLNHENFQWCVNYVNNLPGKWKSMQEDEVQNFIDEYFNDKSRWHDDNKKFLDAYEKYCKLALEKSDSEREVAKKIIKEHQSEPIFYRLMRLAEYLKYMEFNGAECKYELIFIHNTITDRIRGCAYFKSPILEKGNEIPITGEKTTSQLTIRYKQPEQTLKLGEKDLFIPIRHFDYEISFSKDASAANLYKGIFMHPDYRKPRQLMIGETELLRLA